MTLGLSYPQSYPLSLLPHAARRSLAPQGAGRPLERSVISPIARAHGGSAAFSSASYGRAPAVQEGRRQEGAIMHAMSRSQHQLLRLLRDVQ
jgi:hypothetical protein